MIPLFFMLVAAFWIVALVATRISAADKKQRLDAPSVHVERRPLPDVDVVVPARNEERNVRECLESIVAQDHRPAKIVVVDDDSTDGTGAIVDAIAARDPRVVRVRGDGPPDGWKGKPAALTAGLAATTAPWILFVDADVRLAPENLRAALEEVAARTWQGLSLWGTWILPAGPVRWMQSFVGSFVRGIHPLDRVNDPAKKEAFLNGQYLLIERGALATLGNFSGVKSAVLEDVALAKLAKAKGVRIGLLRAPELMRVAPYTSLHEVWEGYAKNFVEGAGGPGLALLLAAAVLFASVAPFVVALVGLVRAAIAVAARGTSADPATVVIIHALGDPLTLSAFAASAAAVIHRMATARFHSHPKLEAFLHPVAGALFAAMIVDAVRRRRSGAAVLWKGRAV